MQFTSIRYLLFLLVVLVAIASFARVKNSRWVLLLIASYYFYFTWQPFYMLLLFAVTVIGYFTGASINRTADMRARRRRMLTGVIAMISLLFFFKYSVAINEGIRALLRISGSGRHFTGLDILMPVGISFYTFQTLSYVFDVYYKMRKEETHFGHFATYIGSFPQLLSGPIERSRAFIDQVKNNFVFDWPSTIIGLRRIAWGMFKKMVVADRIGVLVDHVYDDPTSFHGAALIFATLLFAFQLYFDFSAYADIAIGSARVLGIKLSENFNFPFASRNVTEFWRRWHITLGNWLRDYVYNPILFSKKKWQNRAVYFSLFITFFICGLWHGPRWTYVIFGTMQGLVMIAEIILARQRKKAAKSKWNGVYFSMSWFATFLFILLSDIFFRANTTKDSFYIIGEIFSGGYNFNEVMAIVNAFRPTRVIFSLMLLVALILCDKPLSRLASGERTFGATWNTLIFAMLTVAILIWGDWGEVRFVYLQF